MTSRNNNRLTVGDNYDNHSVHSTNSTTLDESSSLASHHHASTAQSTTASNPVLYEKLIQDYVKLKSKLNVLKKAYVDLNESTAQKDQAIRKYEQEIEGLTFRNQQMTARVESLQKEIDQLKSSQSQSQLNHHSGSFTTNGGTLSSNSSIPSGLSGLVELNGNGIASPVNNSSLLPPIEVLAEELQHKINENTTLHRYLNELEAEFRQKLSKSDEINKQMEQERASLEKKLEIVEQESKTTIERLQNDKIKLELSLIQMENQLRNEAGNGLAGVIKSPISSPNSSLNGGSSNSNNKQLEVCFKSIIDSVGQIYTCLGEFQRFEKVSAKCQKLLASISMQPDSLDDTLNLFYESNVQFVNEIAKSLDSASNNGHHASPEVDKVNKKLKIYLSKLKQLLFASQESDDQISSLFTSILFGMIKYHSSQMERSEFEMLLSVGIEPVLEATIDIIDKLLFVLNEKLPLEYSLNFSTRLTSRDECLVSYLTQLKQLFAQFLLYVKSGCSLIETLDASRKTTITSSLSSSSSSLLAAGTGSLPLLSSPSKVKAELDALRANYAKKETELKETKETLERSLNELKLQLVTQEQKIKQQEEEMVKLRLLPSPSSIQPPAVTESSTGGKNQQDKIVVQILDQLDVKLAPSTLEMYASQVQMLMKRVQHLDGRALYYKDEWRSAREQLKQQLQALKNKENELSGIKDELERTRRGYETQMSTLSDHLIEVNDKMAQQLEENERLKHELNTSSFFSSSSSNHQSNNHHQAAANTKTKSKKSK